VHTRERMGLAAGSSPNNERPLRVLHLVSLFPCWSETFIVREIDALLRQGVEVRILSLKHPSEKLVHPQAQQLQDRVTYPPAVGVAFVRVAREVLGAPRLQVRILGLIVRSLGTAPLAFVKTLVTWWRALAVAQELRRDRPDLLHAHWATYPSTAAWILSEALGTPFSFTSHAHDIFVEDHILREKLLRASFAVTISEFNRQTLREQFGPRAVRELHVIRCGVSVDEFEYRPEGREQGYILTVARLEEIKGLPYLVKACLLLRDRGVAVRCDIVGEGRLRREIEALIVRNGLRQVVRLRGALDQREVRELFYRASVFALPCVVTRRGDRDGVPVVLMEAMAAGVPVISTSVSGIPELVRDGVNGRLVAPGDPVALADAIQSLLGDPTLSARLFNVDREAEKLLRCFEIARGRRDRQKPEV